jgi:hypothetical protein
MALVGIGIILFLVSLAGLLIERMIHTDNPAWLMGILIIVLILGASIEIPHHEIFEVRIPECVEKTSFLLTVKDNKFGVLSSDKIALWNSPTNDIVIYSKKWYNVFDFEKGTEVSIANKNDEFIKVGMEQTGETNENNNIKQ